MRKIKRKLAVLFCIMGCVMLSGCASSGTVIFDGEQNEIGSLGNIDKSENWAYLQLVEDEAVEILCDKNACSEEEARTLLAKEKYSIHTYFDKKIFDEMKKTYQIYENGSPSFGCAATDLNGQLIAIYSSGSAEKNFALEKQAPYSSFKPMSVYLPSLESGNANWSKTYEDSPFKQIVLANGDKENWPNNVTGVYSNEEVMVKDALRLSLNTVAVKCLDEYGVKRSMDFLEERFDLRLDFERDKLKQFGEEEILGNIALGYLEEGVSPVDMAGYYQIFANGGNYIPPKTIYKITDEGGETIYQHTGDTAKQVITKEAAYVMNHLLQNVVSSDGTGADAEIPGVEIGGKTGTGEEGNWFVGFTPEYTCAVWHGPELSENYAATMFAETVSTWAHDSAKTYPECGTVKEAIYCKDSGRLMTESCKEFELGYYMSVSCPDECKRH